MIVVTQGGDSAAVIHYIGRHWSGGSYQTQVISLSYTVAKRELRGGFFNLAREIMLLHV